MAKDPIKKVVKFARSEGAKIAIDVGKIIHAGFVSEDKAEDVARISQSVRRRHPNLSQGKVDRRIRIRLKLLSLSREGREAKPLAGMLSKTIGRIEKRVIAHVNAENKKADAIAAKKAEKKAKKKGADTE